MASNFSNHAYNNWKIPLGFCMILGLPKFKQLRPMLKFEFLLNKLFKPGSTKT